MDTFAASGMTISVPDAKLVCPDAGIDARAQAAVAAARQHRRNCAGDDLFRAVNICPPTWIEECCSPKHRLR
ncbi:MAG TPA: hypothetical protein VF059_13180, partial [Casimicrobiaceae bacterium]